VSASTAQVGPRVPVGRVTQARVMLSEWTKLRSLRSTRWALFVTLLLTIGIGLLVCTVFAARWPNLSPGDRARYFRNPLRVELAGVNLDPMDCRSFGGSG
jgi:hypothetical protein